MRSTVVALIVVCAAVAAGAASSTVFTSTPPSIATGPSPFAPGCDGVPQSGTLYENAEVEPRVAVPTHSRAAGLMLGADDYIVKPLDPLMARMRRSLRRSAKPVETRRAPGRPNGDMPTLSPREREILTLLAEGNTQTQIAADLVLSPRTVATHIQNLLRMLGVHSRAEAVVAAYRAGLVGAVGPDDAVHAHVLTAGGAAV
jgi:DNA-binding CsgD family transcriptional regulator